MHNNTIAPCQKLEDANAASCISEIMPLDVGGLRVYIKKNDTRFRTIFLFRYTFRKFMLHENNFF